MLGTVLHGGVWLRYGAHIGCMLWSMHMCSWRVLSRWINNNDWLRCLWCRQRVCGQRISTRRVQLQWRLLIVIDHDNCVCG